MENVNDSDFKEEKSKSSSPDSGFQSESKSGAGVSEASSMMSFRSTSEGTADGVDFRLDIPQDFAPPASYYLTPTFQIENVMASEFMQWTIIELIYTSVSVAFVCKAWKKIVERMVPAEILQMVLFLKARAKQDDDGITTNVMPFLQRNLNLYVNGRMSKSVVFYQSPTNLVSSCHLIRTILYNVQTQQHADPTYAGPEDINDLYQCVLRSMVITRLHQLDKLSTDTDENLWNLLAHIDTTHRQVELMFDVNVERHLGMCFAHLNKSLLKNQETSLAGVRRKVMAEAFMGGTENTLPRRCDMQFARLPVVLVEKAPSAIKDVRMNILRRLNANMEGCFGPLFTAAMKAVPDIGFDTEKTGGLKLTSVGTLVDETSGGGGATKSCAEVVSGGSGPRCQSHRDGEVQMVTMLFAHDEWLTYPATHPVFRQSKYFAGLGLRHGDVSTFDVSQVANIKPEVFLKVVEFVEYHEEHGLMATIQKPLVSPNLVECVDDEWDADFVSVDQEMVFEIILAANNLDIPSLLDLACAKVASLIKGKTPEEIRETFNIVNDFTPEEEAQVREENAWCAEA